MKSKEVKQHINELEAKIHILERENEILAAKAEENLLLNKAFEEISSYNDLNYLLENTLESTSILLGVDFAGVFRYDKGIFEFLNGYSLINEDENTIYEVVFDKENLNKTNLNIPAFFSNENLSIKFLNSDIDFQSHCSLLIPFSTEISHNLYFIFSNNENCDNLNERLNLLIKVTEIISARLDRLFYQNELKKLNKDLHDSNSVLKEKMSQLKEAQNRLIHAEKMASLGILTAGIAHEINNPLNYILGAMHGLEKYFQDINEDTSEDVKFYLECISTGVEKSSDIIKGLKDFSRDSNNYSEKCEVIKIIDSCTAILNSQIKNKISLSKNYESGPIIIDGNVGKLHQVFINIINNSIQSITSSGSINISTKIVVDNVVITIQDNGCGIEQTEINKIFDPFYTTKDPGEGTGLGLSLSYSIIKDHKGSIQYESVINEGTIATITIPLKKS